MKKVRSVHNLKKVKGALYLLLIPMLIIGAVSDKTWAAENNSSQVLDEISAKQESDSYAVESEKEELSAVMIYDTQPKTRSEVQEIIEAYEAEYKQALLLGGVLAAIDVQKPRWQYEIPMEIMPAGYNCQLANWDTDFGANYYTFYSKPTPISDINETVNDEETLKRAIENAPNTGVLYVIGITRDFDLTSRITVSAGKNIEICSSGGSYVITQNSDENEIRHFVMYGKLTLENITLDGKWNKESFSSGGTASGGGGIDVLSGAELVMADGAKIENCYAKEGGGVYIKEGLFSMSGKSVISGNLAYGMGGGIYINNNNVPNRNFYMQGDAEISDNKTDGQGNPDIIGSGNGGGMYLMGYCTFHMSGNAKISYNKANIEGGSLGAGAYIATQVQFRMSENASIVHNTTILNGGGVCIDDSSTLRMMGESHISNNKAVKNSGGGVYIIQNSTLRMLDESKISDNTAGASGGGIYATLNIGGTLTISMQNDAVISGNESCGSIAASSGGGGVSLYPNAGTADNRAAIQLTMNDNAKIKENKAVNNGGGVYIRGGTATSNSYAELIMSGNNTISKNTAKNHGGGIYLHRTHATIEMFAGSIAGNTAEGNGGGIYINAGEEGMENFIMSGGEVGNSSHPNKAVNGGGVYMNAGIFTMNTGSSTIGYNVASESGGGIYMNGSSTVTAFNMNAGVIRNNCAPNNGAGVAIVSTNETYAPAFNMNAGEIIANGESGSTTTQNGGGVYLDSEGGTFTMEGGNIGGTGVGNKALKGGGAYVKNGTYIMEAGTIKSNIATLNGGGVCMENGTLTMEGGDIGASENGNQAVDGGGVYVDTSAAITLNAGTIGYNTASENGGGIYAAGEVKVGTESGKMGYITGNTAPNGHGGGIYTTRAGDDYSNMTVFENIVFSNNSASIQYERPEVSEAPAAWLTRIKNYTSSITGSESNQYRPLNNYDINSQWLKPCPFTLNVAEKTLKNGKGETVATYTGEIFSISDLDFAECDANHTHELIIIGSNDNAVVNLSGSSYDVYVNGVTVKKMEVMTEGKVIFGSSGTFTDNYFINTTSTALVIESDVEVSIKTGCSVTACANADVEPISVSGSQAKVLDLIMNEVSTEDITLEIGGSNRTLFGLTQRIAVMDNLDGTWLVGAIEVKVPGTEKNYVRGIYGKDSDGEWEDENSTYSDGDHYGKTYTLDKKSGNYGLYEKVRLPVPMKVLDVEIPMKIKFNMQLEGEAGDRGNTSWNSIPLQAKNYSYSYEDCSLGAGNYINQTTSSAKFYYNGLSVSAQEKESNGYTIRAYDHVKQVANDALNVEKPMIALMGTASSESGVEIKQVGLDEEQGILSTKEEWFTMVPGTIESGSTLVTASKVQISLSRPVDSQGNPVTDYYQYPTDREKILNGVHHLNLVIEYQN